jgi:hypothetical protein
MLKSDHVAIVRKPTVDDPQPVVLGVTSDAWVAASYPELAGALDDLATTHKVETAGVLKRGGLAFLCFRAPDWSVRGDEMRSYFAATFSLTPGVGHKVFHSPVRVVCWNTLTMAEGQATINLSVPHASDSLQRIQLASRLVSQFKESQERTRAIFGAFADRRITGAEAEAIFAAAFPNPPVPAKVRLIKSQLNEVEAEVFKRALTPDMLQGITTAQEQYDRACERAAALRNAAVEQFEKFEPTILAGTAWAAYNAATEISDWREGRGADESALFGSRAKEKARAFGAALELVEVRTR